MNCWVGRNEFDWSISESLSLSDELLLLLLLLESSELFTLARLGGGGGGSGVGLFDLIGDIEEGRFK